MKNTLSKNYTIDRSMFDAANKDTSRYKAAPGLTRDVVLQISKEKNEPAWMLEKRLKAYEYFMAAEMPTWGPDLSELDLDTISYFIQPDAREERSWDDVPEDIKQTFDKLGIPEAEKAALAGVGAQYDSEMVYHNIKEDLAKQGVVFVNMDTAVHEYPEMVKKYFMTQCVPINDHKFVMMHGAVWSGGTFIYIPKGVKVALPLQAYFRMNTESGGQFEHTLIIADEGAEVQYIEGCSAPRYTTNSIHAGCVEIFVHKHARVSYFSIENWSKNTYNLNTKRALVDECGVIDWVNGNMGSGKTMLYPSSVLRGRGAKSDSLGIAFAGDGQDQDTGAKVIHAAPETTSTIRAKSISRSGGIASYRGLVQVKKKAEHTVSSVECDALLIGDGAVSQTFPYMDVANSTAQVAHEARVGRIGDEEVFYLMSRGLNKERAMQLVVNGFIEPVIKALPLEYALELNRLIELEMEGAIG